jgi:predicted NAD-dependent protein-ADP-ribosyltransferase YbiA (DUF1768 family)
MTISRFYPLLSSIVFLALLSLGARPLQAQEIPAGLIETSIAAMRNAQLPDKAGALGAEARRPYRRSPITLYNSLRVGVYAAAAADMIKTESSLPNFREADPLARPLIGLPAPLYFGIGALTATGINLLGARMQRSTRWHKIWWLPQAVSIAGNLSGYAYTSSNTYTISPSFARSKGR